MAKTGLRSQRVSRFDLVEKSSTALVSAGVRHHCRALFLSNIAHEALDSDNPAFKHFRAHVLRRTSLAWVRAYTILFQYLSEQHLPITKEIALRENRESFPPSDGSSSTADDQLTDLVGAVPAKMSIRQRLDSPRAATKSRKGSSKSSRRTPTRRPDITNIVIIASPAARKKELRSDSDAQSDFVIEEIKPRRHKR
jgi:hypothetical protein